MKPIDVVFLFGAACVSPADHVPHGIVLHKTPCAEVIYLIANPYKAAQEQNTITIPPGKSGTKRTSLCGSKRPVWYVKGSKRKYRCR